VEQEFFIDAEKAAEFLGITQRHLLQLARAKRVPAHPINWGKKGSRSVWRFLRSELRAWLLEQQ
jgi:hypothetical protein